VKRLLSLLLLAACAAPLLAADRELIVASPHWEGVRTEFGDAFAIWYRARTGHTVDVRWLDLGGTSQIEKAIDAAYRATPDACGIDVLFGGGMDPFENQKAKGRLQPFRLPDAFLHEIPRDAGGVPLVDPDFCFYAAALSSFGILENVRIKERLGLPEVKTWDDLAQPALLDWVSSADPRKSGSVHMIYEIILQAYGWEKGWSVIYRTSGNVRTFFQNSSQPTKEIGAGDAAEAVTIDLNGMTQEAFLGRENVRYLIPRGLSILSGDGIGILKGAPNRDVAEAFVTFVMSEEGQRLWMTPTGAPGGPVKYPISRMGVRPALYAGDLARLAVPFNPFTTSSGFTYDGKLGSRRWNVVNDLIGQTVIDVHGPLKAAWKAILRVPEARRGPLLDEFAAPPISEAEAMADAAFWRTDRLRAGELSNRWMADAVARYRRIEAEANVLAHSSSP